MICLNIKKYIKPIKAVNWATSIKFESINRKEHVNIYPVKQVQNVKTMSLLF